MRSCEKENGRSLTFVGQLVVVGLCIVAVEDVGGNVGSLVVRGNHSGKWRRSDGLE